MQAKVAVPLLTRKGNWIAWETKISAYLALKSPPLSAYLHNPPNPSDANEKEQDRQCRAILILYVDDDLASDIRASATANESYEILKNVLLHEKEVRGQILNQRISALHQGTQNSDDYVREAQKLMIEAQDLGETTYMRNVCSQLVMGLAPTVKNVLLDNLMTVIETKLSASSKASEISTVFQTMEARIRARCHMLWNSQSKDKSEEQAMMFAVPQPTPPQYTRAPIQHAPSRPLNPPHRQDIPPKRREVKYEDRACYYCGKAGHIKRNCHKFRADMQQQLQRDRPIQMRPVQQEPAVTMQVQNMQLQQQLQRMQEQINRLSTRAHAIPEDDDELPQGGHSRMYSTRAVVTQVKNLKSDWTQLLLDGGSTHHVVKDKSLISNRTASHINEVLVAGGEPHEVTCCGSMLVQTPLGQLVFQHVLCVPTFIVNLLSVPQLDDQDFSVHHQRGKVIIKNDKDVIILRGTKEQGLYTLDCTILQSIAQANSAVSNNVQLLHRRLGHPGMRATREVMNGNAVLGLMHDLHACAEDYCEVCRNSKEHRAHFSPSPNKLAEPLQIIHSDLMGPFRCVSSGGHSYICSLYDQFSGYGEVFLLRAKSQVNTELRTAIYRWQRQTGRKVKIIRTDRGKEYEGKFQRFIRREGIVHQRSAAYTPEQNGVAERYNRTLIERIRALLNEFNLPTFLWGEAAKTASHLRNLMPRSRTALSPYELMFNVKPSADHLRVFGCTVHIHVPKKQIVHKTDPVGRTGMFVGYAENSKAYRVLVWDSGKLSVLESASCTFAEHTSPTIDSRAHRAVDMQPRTSVDSDEEDFLVEDLFLPRDGDTQATIAPQTDAANSEVYEEYSEHDGSGTDEDTNEHQSKRSDEIVSLEEDGGEQAAYQIDRHYPPRVRKPPNRLVFKVQAAHGKGDFDNPSSIQEALSRPDASLWLAAINAELTAMYEKDVYEQCDLPPGKRALSTKMILHIKRDKSGNIDRYKARLVVRGFLQEKDVDFSEVFAPTAQAASLRVLTSIAAQKQLDIQQIDVSTAFLNGVLEEEVFVKLPAAFSTTTQVWRLKKALYGLKQAARVWNETLSKELIALGFNQSGADPCLFYQGSGETTVYLLVHVDDAIIVGKSDLVQQVKGKVSAIFDIKDLGAASYSLSIEIHRSGEGISLSQGLYVQKLMAQFGMAACNGEDTPMVPGAYLMKEGTPLPAENRYCALVGGLLYLAVNTRPDISFAVGCLSRFMNAPTEEHMNAAKQVLQYLSKYPDRGLFYGFIDEKSTEDMLVHVFTDADFAGERNGRKSTSGLLLRWGDHPITWSSKLQPIVTTSTTEAEFVAAAAAVKEGLWVRKLLTFPKQEAHQFILHCDNTATIQLITRKTAGVGGRTKHIDVQYMFLRDRYLRNEFRLENVSSKENLADLFTKPLPGPAFRSFVTAIGMR
jgi:transposase InsO family protein